ncbi:MAG: alpha/beta hydrolase fold domain-containing protein [Tenericutes bacterium]|nr:alpha/beta hydrolase fold domain-containing protein [Mycoplasmatota bacterium]
MLIYKSYSQKPSDKIGFNLMKEAQKIDAIKYRRDVNIRFLYKSALSKNYHYPRNIAHEIIDFEGLIVESISRNKEEIKYALIQLHGGAYVSGFNDTYRKSARKYLRCMNNLKVFSLRYSLAPKYPFPKALNETVSLYKHLLDLGYKPENIIIAGDSAGGGLAIASTLFLRDNLIPLPKAIITMSAWTNLGMDGESHEKNKEKDPMFGVGSVPLNVEAYTQGQDHKNPYISPVYGDFEEFCDMLMFVGGSEIIESDTLDIAKKAGITNEIQVHDFQGMFHVFPFGFNLMASSKTSWKIIKDYINKKLG